MKSLRNRLRSAALSIPFTAAACFSPPGAGHGSSNGSPTDSSSLGTAAGVVGSVGSGRTSSQGSSGTSGSGATLGSVGSTTVDAAASFASSSGSSGTTGASSTTGGSTGTTSGWTCDSTYGLFVASDGGCLPECTRSCGGCYQNPVLVAAAAGYADDGQWLPSSICNEDCMPFGLPGVQACTAVGAGAGMTYDGGQPGDPTWAMTCYAAYGCTGRRPSGLAEAKASSSGSDVGAFLASAAHLEAASVPAFRRLERSLRRMGSPVSLQRRARAAARDEVRHTRVMEGLARARGGERPAVELAIEAPASLFDLALENEVEGCVHEAFGAALAFWQAEHATDPEVRGAMAAIAEDESDHAQLALDIARWARRQLSSEARAELDDRRQEAIAELRRSGQTPVPRALTEQLGLPSPEAHAELVSRLVRDVWS